MGAMKSDPSNEPRPRAQSFRVEPGDGSEPPRLIIEFSRFEVDDDPDALRQRVASLEAQMAAMASTISMLRTRLEASR